MSTSGNRKEVIDLITPQLPKSWKLIPYTKNLDALGTQIVVMLKLQSIERTPAAPNAAHDATYILTVVEPKVNPGTLDDSLDDSLDKLLFALDGVKNLNWTRAERVLVTDTNDGYDITLEVTTGKDE